MTHRRFTGFPAEPITDAGGGDTDRPASPIRAGYGSEAGLETAYCAVVAVTYQEMGLLPRDRIPNWYDLRRFWSGDDLDLAPGFRLGGEIAVTLPSAVDGH